MAEMWVMHLRFEVDAVVTCDTLLILLEDSPPPQRVSS